MTTTVTPEQFSAAYKSSLETFFSLANSTLQGVEKLVDLNLSVAKANLEETAAKTTELLSVKDVQGLMAFQTSQLQPSAEKAVAYSRSVYKLATDTQAEFTKVAEEKIADGHQTLVSLVDSATKNAPAGSETAVAAVKSALAAASSAYDSMNKAAKQAAEITEANLTAATNAAVKTAGQAASAASAKKAA